LVRLGFRLLQRTNEASRRPAPENGSADTPTFEELTADPEIAALLEFKPVLRKRNVEGAWTPKLQRELVARIAVHGSPARRWARAPTAR
jgi:hypothetical protein